MTDEKRLENIKPVGVVIKGEDWRWFTEQAQKNITCQEVVELQGDALKGILEQNKRYREALEEVLKSNISTWGFHRIARKALEESQ